MPPTFSQAPAANYLHSLQMTWIDASELIIRGLRSHTADPKENFTLSCRNRVTLGSISKLATSAELTVMRKQRDEKITLTQAPSNQSMESFHRERERVALHGNDPFEVSNDQEQTCSVCCQTTRDVTIPQGDTDRVTSSCTTIRTVCTSCVTRHIKDSMFVTGRVDEISCIDGACEQLLTYEDVRRHLPDALFMKYDLLLLRRFLEASDQFRWCSNSKCESGQIHEDQDRAPIMTCHVCHEKTCFIHQCPWHTGVTCYQFDGNSEVNEEASVAKELRKQDIKQCPKCGHGIFKTDGCDHIICDTRASGCGAQFCWLCLADYCGPSGISKIGNRAHRKTCPYYA